VWVSAFLFLAALSLNSNGNAQTASHLNRDSRTAAMADSHSGPDVQSRDLQSPDLQSIVARVEDAQQNNPARYRPYVLTREYKFYHGDTTGDPKSEVVAEVSFVPPNTKSFDILNTRGSGRGTSVVKHILESEAELAKDVTTNEVSRRNYEFALAGDSNVNGHTCHVLTLKPKREERSLFNGKVCVDAMSYRILKLEGQPSRSPSWWLKSTYITLTFGDVDGLWLPVATHGTSELRMFGRYTLASEKIGQRVGAEVASLQPSRTGDAGASVTSRREKPRKRSMREVGAAVPLK
jgi:hypothetical protein